ncbi:MAG: hypothetical protein ACLQVD_13405 [Capsulimonadaceae bacterium]
MGNLPSNRFTRSLGGMVSFWRAVRAVSIAEISAESERPFQIALFGRVDECEQLADRLAREASIPRDTLTGPPDIRPYLGFFTSMADIPASDVFLDAGLLHRGGEAALAEALAGIVVDHPDLRLTLARHVPAFRPAVAAQIVTEVSWLNAKIAVVSALPGVIPLTDILLPAAALGDMMLLTKNQILLLLRIAAAYGLPVDLRARTRELVPVVGGAFGWRAIARELIGLVPGGLGVIVKGAVAYSGTYTVGKAAMIYYSTGQSLTKPRLKRLYLDAYASSIERLKGLWRRGRSRDDLASAIVAEQRLTEPPASLEQ